MLHRLCAAAQFRAYTAHAQAPEYGPPETRLGAPFHRIDSAGLQLSLWRRDGYDLIAIAGTDELQDWLANLPLPTWLQYRGTRVLGHLGYRTRALRANELLCQQVALQSRIVLCGHSQGGAIAMYLPLVSTSLAQRTMEVVTFGAPKCLSPELAALYPEGLLTRYVRRLDVVPDLPFGDWSHAGLERYYTDTGEPTRRNRADGDALEELLGSI